MSNSILCEAVLFDLDGVLADSNDLVERHLGIWAGRHGIPFEKVLAIHHGRPTVETMMMLAPELDAAAEALLLEEMVADDTEGVRAFPGAARLVAELPDDRWAVATSGTARIATTRLTHIGIPHPRVFITANDISRGKPDPEPYLLAADRLRFSAADCVVIEDAPAGIASGKAAGATVIAIASTLPREALGAADIIVDRIDDISAVRDEGKLRLSWK